MSDKSSVIGPLAIGIIAGSLIGVAVAMLSTPQSGSQTRALLRDKGTELIGKASTTVQETRSKAEDVITRVRSRAADLTQRGKSAQLPEEVTELVV